MPAYVLVCVHPREIMLRLRLQPAEISGMCSAAAAAAAAISFAAHLRLTRLAPLAWSSPFYALLIKLNPINGFIIVKVHIGAVSLFQDTSLWLEID